MTESKLSALDPQTLPERVGSGYPEPFRSEIAGRRKRALGDAFGLTGFGVNLVRLPPGCPSSMRHWHTREDELVYVLSGELVLVTDAGEQTVSAGMVVGFPGGWKDAHHFVNRSGAPALYIEVGSRIEEDEAFYPDDDLMWVRDGRGGRGVPAHKDGSPY